MKYRFEDVVKVIRDRETQIVISSAKKEILQELRTVDPSISIVLIFAMNPEKNLKTAEKLGCIHIQPHWAIRLFTDLIEQAHEKEMKTFVWSINTDVGTQIFQRLDADSVIADRLMDVDRLSSYSSQGETIFDQPPVQELGVALLPIALRSVMYPFVLLGACISVVGWSLGTIPINVPGSGRVGCFLTESSSTVKRKVSVLLWKGKHWLPGVTADGGVHHF